MALAFINAQAYVYHTMELPIADSAYPGMFYAITGTVLALAIIGLVFTAVTAFRILGGRSGELELVSCARHVLVLRRRRLLRRLVPRLRDEVS